MEWTAGELFVILGIYFMPTWTAFARKHRNREGIMLLNLLLGWTVLGWIVALIWAVSKPAPTPSAT